MTQTPTPARETKSQLARRLKIHRHQLDSLLARPGSPSPDKAKRYAVAVVAAFVASQKADGSLDTLRAARLTEIKLRCEGLRRQLARDDRQVVTIEEMNVVLKTIANALRTRIFYGAESELPVKLDGLPASECRRILREWADGTNDVMRDCLEACPVKFGFPDMGPS